MPKTILYLCPSFPYPANNGGKVVFISHINFFKNNNFKIHLVFLDVDGNVTDENIASIDKKDFESFDVFSRNVPRIKGFGSIIKSLFYFAFNKRPRAFLARYNPELQEFVSKQIKNFNYDHVIFDHFTSLAFIDDFEILKSCNSIYIAHNFEAKVIADQYKSKGNPLTRLVYYIEYYKTKILESKIIEKVAATITISSKDKTELSDFYDNLKIKNIPEILPLNNRLWDFNESKNILFVGGTDYYPNYEAVDWIVKVLMPELNKLDQNINCTIVGNCENYSFRDVSANIIFAGRINDDELENLYCSSNLFISPVTLGSGIKVKVLTALSYSIPLICTSESMYGIDYITDVENIIFNREYLELTIAKILKILNDKEEQMRMSASVRKNIKQNYELISKQWELDEI